MERKFRITSKERQTEKGAKFLVHSAKINDNWFKVKFNQSCTNVPKDRGLYYVTADDKDLNIQHKVYTKKDGSKGTENILWVHECKLEPVSEEEMNEYRSNMLNEIFGLPKANLKEVNTDEELSF